LFSQLARPQAGYFFQEAGLANHKSALKRQRQGEKRAVRNRGLRTQIKTITKKVTTAVEENKGDEARKALAEAEKTIAKMASKGVVHRRAASRKISGLTRRVNTLNAAGA